ncbi:MAG: oxidoreductase-like domain-containing protein [Azoarcus sp.]|nr:oxidoreductase-like domain-containing protein [Azoarcus sp.]
MRVSRDPFLLPLKNLDDALALVAALQCLAEIAGVTLRPPPPVPTTCCGRGCNGCVWQGYFSALCYWRDQAADKLER